MGGPYLCHDGWVGEWPVSNGARKSHAGAAVDYSKNKVSFSLNRDQENQNEMQQASLPQLKPGGVNLSRPVRSVAALPGGRGVVQVGELGNLEDTEIGLEAGLGPDLWQASRFF